MIRKSTNDLSIRPKVSNAVKAASLCVFLIVAIGALYFTYSSGVRSGHTQYDQDQALVERLQSTIAELRAELNASEEGLIFAQRQKQIQEEAYKQLSKAYSNSEQKNRVLGSRLDFYRSIISPEDGQSGPAIQSLVSQLNGTQLSFDITLVQAIRHKHQVRGNLKVTLYQGDVAVGQWPASSVRSVNYQYFQQISGVIEDANIGDNARIKVELSILDGENLERWFDLSESAQIADDDMPTS